MDFDVAIIGAGISGIATLKTLLELGLRVVVIEATEFVGGLWRYSRDGYGVMAFTHINVPKLSYCFSDFPFPEDPADHPHHKDIYKYICSYTQHFDLCRYVKFNTRVDSTVFGADGRWRLHCTASAAGNAQLVVECTTLVVASGHHAKPRYPDLKGQETFRGTIMHSVAYKDVHLNGLYKKKVVVVGIGNSAVDIAVNIAESGGTDCVHVSTRSGAWVMPLYMYGYPSGYYPSRFMKCLPWQINQFIGEFLIKLTSGPPERWNLNPKMGFMQAHPTVSSTLIHHIQRKRVKIVGDVKAIQGNRFTFADGTSVDDVEALIYCTGYNIDLPFLPSDIAVKIHDRKKNALNLFNAVFSPDVGHSLAFIGFFQPLGSLLSMSEMQAQWLGQILIGRCSLPSPELMRSEMKIEKTSVAAQYWASPRHTIQTDPIIYNDKVASFFGAKPQLWRHPTLAMRLLFNACGASQWRLQGPYKWKGAAAEVRRVPTPQLIQYMSLVFICLLLSLVVWCYVLVH